METTMNGAISVDLKNDLKQLFKTGVWFKQDTRQEENLTIWNLFLARGKNTICIIDKQIYGLAPAKVAALENLIEKYHLNLCGISSEYAYFKYALA